MKTHQSNFVQTIFKSLFICILLMATTQIGVAQKNNIKVTGLTFGQYNFSFETAIDSTHSFTFGLASSYVDYERHPILPTLFQEYTYRKNGSRIVGEFRVYFSEKEISLNGMYVAANASIGKNTIKHNAVPEAVTYSTGSLGLKIGWQIHAGPLLFDLGGNLSGNTVFGNKAPLRSKETGVIDFKSDMKGFNAQLYLGLGFAF